jgi:hypothetical protein
MIPYLTESDQAVEKVTSNVTRITIHPLRLLVADQRENIKARHICLDTDPDRVK